MKRSLIMRAGAEALARGGIDELDLNGIAGQVGLKPSSLRYYFANREALAEALYDERLGEFEAAIEHAAEAGTLEDFVRDLCAFEIDNYADYLAGKIGRKPQLGEVRALSRERRHRIGGRYRKMLGRTGEHLHRYGVTVPPTMPMLPAHLLLENLFWMPAWIDHFHAWEFEQVKRELTELLCHGIFAEDASLELPESADADLVPEPAAGNDERNEAFLKAATKLISQRGYRGTSIDAIAAELGLTKGSFYHHNSEKELLVGRCFASSYQRVGELQRRANAGARDPVSRFLTVVGAVIAVQMEGSEPIMRSSALPGLPPDLRTATIAGGDSNDRWYVTELARAQATGKVRGVDPYIAAQVISCGTNSSYDLVQFYGYGGSDGDFATVNRLLLKGFANRV